MNHAFIDCAAALRAAHGIPVDDVEPIECFIHPREVPVVCEPLVSKQAPQTDYDAKFSLPYAVACTLVRGHVAVDDFHDRAIREPAVLALAQRVVYREDPTSDYPRYFPGFLRLRLRNGRTLEHREPINRGSTECPMSEAEVREKFRRNARRAIDAEAAERIVALVGALEDQHDLRALGQALTGTAD